MSDELVFRFMSVRQPAKTLEGLSVTQDDTSRLAINLHAKPETELQQRIKSRVQSGQEAEARKIAEEAKKQGHLLNTLDGLDMSIVNAINWAQLNQNQTLVTLNIDKEIKTLTGMSLKDLVASQVFIATKHKLEDSLVIAATLGESSAVNALALETLKILKLLESAANDTLKPKAGLTLSVFLSASTVIIPSPNRGDIGAKTTPPPELRNPQPELEIDQEALKKRFDLVRKVRDDLATQLRGKAALTVNAKQTVDKLVLANNTSKNPATTGIDTPSYNAAVTAMLSARTPEAATYFNKIALPAAAGAQSAISTVSNVAISSAALGKMKAENLKSLKSFIGNEKELSPIRTMALLDRELQTLSATMSAPSTQNRYVRFAGGYINAGLLLNSAGLDKFRPLMPSVIAQCRYDVGVADLLLVKQTLKAYELADFAHIENALRGELREREHRRLNLQEETSTIESERETERERNLQSTERNEMQAEASKQVRTDAGVQAGLQVSGSYGPTVSFSASLNASFSSSVQESQRKATSFSREVTEKTSERVRERVRTEQRKRVLEQTEELNRHKIDNSINPTGHVRGIYRWLNKVYDAQVFNYGKRMMYEFMIPEPAAYLVHTLVEHPPADTTLPPKPDAPTYPPSAANGAALKPENLTRYNYQSYIAQYHITNAPALPSEFKVIAHFDKLDGQENPANFGRAAKLAIPDDYEATGAYASRYYVFPKDQNHALKLVIGGDGEDIGTAWGARYISFDEPFRGEVSISYGGFGLLAFALGVDVFCYLTEEGFGKWQQKMYDAIIEAYERMRGDYEEQLAASQIAQGVKIIGRNPLQNRRMEQDELKKWIIMILRGTPYMDFNAFLSSSEPAIDISKACKNGKLIRFLENAFEWHNMSYICYAYFWGRHARWSSALHFTDPDPDFAEFLKAGAARVQLPVRPGFETAIAHFCDTGAIPEGEATLVGGSMYVPIVQEITESLGKLDDGVPYPEGAGPWEVRVPTSLVLVQDLEEISGIRDVLTGTPMKLSNAP